MADVEALITMDPSPDNPKGAPLVNGSQRLTLADKLTPQVTLCSICCVLAKHCIAQNTCMSVLFRPFAPFSCPLPPPQFPFSPLICCLATGSSSKSLINIAAALDVM